ncbi:biotin/lipoate--protein ligase family protein [Limibaculum sp. M0105]|uniref:Biotin/lipoate--protein ligase family protein n=1 Tax=Thermohalobaculum xanthum TaxID=2753746 RepID=A0A8J7M5A7_9RHOB|nr:biotin/lipoate--protein ligase family protein [Thermohalobaculum xanthum]MBK0397644.1 biotin/lipoate--protein ligase family protein [Thermohalobaculum xanthum]
MRGAPAPMFPPLLRGEEAPFGLDPMRRAVSVASLGTDPGLVIWQTDADGLSAAVILAPEQPLQQAMGATFAVALGLGDALGALAPPEVAVHYDWPDGFRVNGARCGRMRAQASTTEPAAEPDWLVIGVEIPFIPPAERAEEPGAFADETCLAEEGCIEVTPLQLLESWSRHMLVWLNRLETEGFPPLHAAWRERGWRIGEALDDGGTFVGLDEHGGQLVRRGETTELRPLSSMLEDAT